jgi:hypothetical protein
MNTLVQTFKDRAGVYDNPDQEGLDLFAELIVQHCADITDSFVSMKVDNNMLSSLILQTFGVNK